MLYFNPTKQMENTPYQEALRYMANAKESLQKAKKEDGLYNDIKYVKTASGTAYSGVLVALDEFLRRKEGAGKFKKPKSIEDYKTRIGKIDKKINVLLTYVYGELHLLGYYHGTNSVEIITNGMDKAYKIIEYIKD